MQKKVIKSKSIGLVQESRDAVHFKAFRDKAEEAQTKAGKSWFIQKLIGNRGSYEIYNLRKKMLPSVSASEVTFMVTCIEFIYSKNFSR